MCLDLPFLTEPVASIFAGDSQPEWPISQADLKQRARLEWFAQQDPRVLFPRSREPQCAFSGLLLWLGGWEQCHTTSQDVEGATGSYWHAIVHRMEPDFWNSDYWFRRVGAYPTFDALSKSAADLSAAYPQVSWKVPKPWNPSSFTKLCQQAASGNGESKALATAIHSLECRLLFRWCAAPAAA